jgi:Holliday junction resolvasome RuvABC endonuclease subunit
MNFKIKDIENKLGKSIRKNCISVGFDVAEKYTGICILKVDNEMIKVVNTLVIETTEKEDHFHRADHFVFSLEKFKQILQKSKEEKIMVIERCYYGKNVETLIHLAHFGILTYITLRKEFATYYYLGATTARSIIGFNQKRQEDKGNLTPHTITRGKNKGQVKKIDCKSLVHDYLKTDFNVSFDSKDKADAFVLALAGLLK